MIRGGSISIMRTIYCDEYWPYDHDPKLLYNKYKFMTAVVLLENDIINFFNGEHRYVPSNVKLKFRDLYKFYRVYLLDFYRRVNNIVWDGRLYWQSYKNK